MTTKKIGGILAVMVLATCTSSVWAQEWDQPASNWEAQAFFFGGHWTGGTIDETTIGGARAKAKGGIDLAQKTAGDRSQEIAHPLAGGDVGLYLALLRAGCDLKGRGQRKGPKDGAHQTQHKLGKD